MPAIGAATGVRIAHNETLFAEQKALAKLPKKQKLFVRVNEELTHEQIQHNQRVIERILLELDWLSELNRQSIDSLK